MVARVGESALMRLAWRRQGAMHAQEVERGLRLGPRRRRSYHAHNGHCVYLDFLFIRAHNIFRARHMERLAIARFCRDQRE